MPWHSATSIPAIEVRRVATDDQLAGRPTPDANQHRAIRESREGQLQPQDHQQVMSDVLDELEALRAIDPVARAELMDELRDTPPDLWPLLVQQFRAGLAYRKQRQERSPPKAKVADLLEAFQAEHPVEVEPAAGYQAKPSPPTTPQVADNADEEAERQWSRVRPADHAEIEERPTSAVATDFEDEHSLDPNPLRPVPARSLGSPNPKTDREKGQHEPRQFSGTDPFRALEEALSRDVSRTNSPTPSTSLRVNVNKWSPPTKEDVRRPEASWHSHLRASIAELELMTQGEPDTNEEVEQQAMLRMLYLVVGRRDDAVAPILGISTTQQDFWQQQLFALSTYLDDETLPDDRRRASRAASYLIEAVDRMGELGSLTIRNLSICSNVRGFGSYDEIDEPRLRPGDKITLYAEVENYRSELTDTGYRTVLATSFQVLDERGNRVSDGQFNEVEDICKNRRRDFHMAYKISLPTGISPGRYRIELVITDQLSNKIGRSSVEFEAK